MADQKNLSYKTIFTGIQKRTIFRKGIDDLMSWLNYTDFYYCPASTRFHGAEPEGLVKHSINVYKHALKLRELYWYYRQISTESLAIAALFHDLCKISCYQEEIRWKKEDDKWQSYTAYKFEEQDPIGGHAAKSLYLLQNFIKLTEEEAAAIMCHMGAYEQTNYTNTAKVYERYLLPWIIHVADEADTYQIPTGD